MRIATHSPKVILPRATLKRKNHRMIGTGKSTYCHESASVYVQIHDNNSRTDLIARVGF